MLTQRDAKIRTLRQLTKTHHIVAHTLELGPLLRNE